jgi:hypothetical protein
MELAETDSSVHGIRLSCVPNLCPQYGLRQFLSALLRGVHNASSTHPAPKAGESVPFYRHPVQSLGGYCKFALAPWVVAFCMAMKISGPNGNQCHNGEAQYSHQVLHPVAGSCSKLFGK